MGSSDCRYLTAILSSFSVFVAVLLPERGAGRCPRDGGQQCGDCRRSGECPRQRPAIGGGPVRRHAWSDGGITHIKFNDRDDRIVSEADIFVQSRVLAVGNGYFNINDSARQFCEIVCVFEFKCSLL